MTAGRCTPQSQRAAVGGPSTHHSAVADRWNRIAPPVAPRSSRRQEHQPRKDTLTRSGAPLEQARSPSTPSVARDSASRWKNLPPPPRGRARGGGFSPPGASSATAVRPPAKARRRLTPSAPRGNTAQGARSHRRVSLVLTPETQGSGDRQGKRSGDWHQLFDPTANTTRRQRHT